MNKDEAIIYYENLESGRKIELKAVANIKRNNNKNCSRYSIYMNGKECQLIDISSGLGVNFVRCPDIEVYESFENKNLVARVEVKSYEKLYNNIYLKIKGAYPTDDFLTIKKIQFDDYISVMEYEETDIFVLFYVYKTNSWYWQSLYNLSNSIKYSGCAYGGDEIYYLWEMNDVREDFEDFLINL